MKSNDVRKKFLDFFAQRKHPIIPSDSLVPSSDPTLLFTSAGMVQFKDYFAGKKKDLSRAASCQKCFRTTDLERIGLTPRHLSFFEMLGNFSFGDYFKKEAIEWGWEFLTSEMNIPQDKLYVTVYKDDDEAYDLWKKIIPEKKIYRLGDDTNFWNMGPTGPCGPCSEIIYDTGESNGCGKDDCDPSCSCARWLEVWNLVFTQFNRLPDGKLEPLPRKNIDTGMGLERLVMVTSGASDVFATDLFKGVIARAAQELGVADDIKIPSGVAPLRLIADHARASLFLLADGIMPSNDGRGYVLRRIIRRAQRFARVIGYDKPFLYKTISAVMDVMSQAYPSIAPQFDNIAAILKNEETKFLETLDAGISVLENLLRRHKDTKHIPGEDAFKLYETYGFPYDLTREMCLEKGFTVDDEGFIRAQNLAREISRASWRGSSDSISPGKNKYESVLSRMSLKPTNFVGYKNLSSETSIEAIISDEGVALDKIDEGKECEIFLAETPFYAESGGQVSDTGELIIEKKNSRAVVKDVRKIAHPGKNGGFIFSHRIKVARGNFSVGDTVSARVDVRRRNDIARHHTATHLLHKALRKFLGETAVQSGSLVAPEYLRFDFAYQASPAQDELEKIEDDVNEAIRADLPVCISEEKLETAKQRGAMALFGEKYGDVVRSVEVRDEVNGMTHSLELCGGTHVKRTGEIGFFKIIQESSVGSGVRRITAVAGVWAEKYVRENEYLIYEMSEALKSPKSELTSKISKLLARIKEVEKKLSAAESKNISGAISSAIEKGKNINGLLFVPFVIQGLSQEGEDVGNDRDRLPRSADMIISVIKSRADIKKGGIALVIDKTQTSYSYVVAVSDDVVSSASKELEAVAIARIFAKATGGSGGGKATFARGGGKDVSKISDGIAAVEDYIRSHIF